MPTRSNVRWIHYRLAIDIDTFGLTAMADWLHTSGTYLNKIACGKELGHRFLKSYADFYGCSIAELMLHPDDDPIEYSNAKVIYFAENLKSVMTVKEMTVNQLARLTGIKKNNIVGYRNGLRIPPTDKMQRLADALNTEVADLFLPPQ